MIGEAVAKKVLSRLHFYLENSKKFVNLHRYSEIMTILPNKFIKLGDLCTEQKEDLMARGNRFAHSLISQYALKPSLSSEASHDKHLNSES